VKKGFWDKRIPTALGLFLIVIGIAITSYFVNQGVFYIIKASPTDNPQEVRITNITDSAATVSFATNGEAIGSVNIGESKDNLQKILDDKDQTSGKVEAKKTHYFTARKLKSSTKYFFSITSGQDTYLNNNAYYELTTGPKIEAEPSSQPPITGKILLPDGKAPNEAIIYTTISNAQTISTMVKSDGTYILPLNSLRKVDLSSYFDFTDNVVMKMTILGDGYSSKILLSKTQINPVPLVTLSKDYDFTTSTEPEASESAKFEKLPSFPASVSKQVDTNSPSIVTPQKEQKFSDLKPAFKGKAMPNETVQIVIHSDNEITTEVTADKYGNWSYQPSQDLSPGKHTISIMTRDAQGILRTITQSFTVYASGSLFTNSSSPTPTVSPASTITPTISPTSALSPTPTIAPTAVPSGQPTPVVTSIPTGTVAPTQTPVPTQIIIQTPTPTIAMARPTSSPPMRPGSSSLINLGFIGITTIILGIILLLLSRGSLSFL
jgi:hypothetical protein